MKKVLIIGMGVSGKGARELLLKQGIEIHCYDVNPQLAFPPPPNLAFDFAVVSPGVPETDPVFRRVLDEKLPWIAEIELALRALRNSTLIGITGTNGKTTVTKLVTHVLNESGIPAYALGNVGVPLSAFAADPQEGILVVELSSYQIDGMVSPVLDTAVILNIAPNHLDRYGSMEAYRASKKRIATLAKEGAYINLAGFPGATFEDRNREAARVITSRYGVTDAMFDRAFATFKKPPHRLAYVSEIDGVKFYNDSKGTNLDAVIKAVESFQQPVVLIAGGREKDTGYTDWIAPFKGRVKGIFLLGEAADRIEREIGAHFPTFQCKTLDRATWEAFSFSKKGDVVLLSPGCSSWDQFKNYEERGEKFVEIVLTIDKKGKSW